MKNNYQNKT